MTRMHWYDTVTLPADLDTGSDGEKVFLKALLRYGSDVPMPDREYRFHATRRWPFDFAWPRVKVALEVSGGEWAGGRHTRGKGYTDDCKKYSMAAAAGWRLLHLTPSMIRDEPATCIGVLRRALRWAPCEKG